MRQTVENINSKLKGSESETVSDKKARAKLNYIKNNLEKNLENYQEKEAILTESNSCSKTNQDAVLMQMKDDHMHNGQLKPAYNTQISMENQFILNYTIHQQTNDFNILEGYLENFERLYGKEKVADLKELNADTGYGSEENYELLEGRNITPYVKYNNFDKEHDDHYEANHKTFSKGNLHDNAEEDFYICPMRKRMEKTH